MSLSDMLDIWSNGACLGYVIAAMERLGSKGEDIQAVVNEIKCGFENTSVKETDRTYCNSRY